MGGLTQLSSEAKRGRKEEDTGSNIMEDGIHFGWRGREGRDKVDTGD